VKVVFDANVVGAGVCWQGEGWLCFVKLARRLAFPYGSVATLTETRETVLRLMRHFQPKHNATGRLAWYLDHLRLVEPMPLGKRRSRDPKDDPYLAAALGAGARAIVTYDRDLLELDKPFGIQIWRPSQFLHAVQPA
jgi:putative PIN family toxin of toxin-antitoxin system